MINQLNYNFIKLVSKQKHTKVEESYIVTGEFIERRYLKPRINKTSTKKRFKFITLRKYNLENIFMENIEYLSAPGFILKHKYGYYKRPKVKKNF